MVEIIAMGCIILIIAIVAAMILYGDYKSSNETPKNLGNLLYAQLLSSRICNIFDIKKKIAEKEQLINKLYENCKCLDENTKQYEYTKQNIVLCEAELELLLSERDMAEKEYNEIKNEWLQFKQEVKNGI